MDLKISLRSFWNNFFNFCDKKNWILSIHEENNTQVIYWWLLRPSLRFINRVVISLITYSINNQWEEEIKNWSNKHATSTSRGMKIFRWVRNVRGKRGSKIFWLVWWSGYPLTHNARREWWKGDPVTHRSRYEKRTRSWIWRLA